MKNRRGATPYCKWLPGNNKAAGFTLLRKTDRSCSNIEKLDEFGAVRRFTCLYCTQPSPVAQTGNASLCLVSRVTKSVKTSKHLNAVDVVIHSITPTR